MDLIITLIPGLGALLLSLYNWYITQRGAILKPTLGYRFGFIKFQSERKLFYIPFDIMNFGTKVGKIDNFEYIFTDPSQKSTIFRPTRRIQVSASEQRDSSGLAQKDLVDLLPTLPIFCPPGEGISEIFEYYEEELFIKPDIDYKVDLKIRYNGNKTKDLVFTFRIPTKIWETARNNIIWVDLQQ